jgi:hypothetical protein
MCCIRSSKSRMAAYRTAWIYTVYRLNWEYPAGGVGKPAGDSRGGRGEDQPGRIALQHQRWRGYGRHLRSRPL